MSDRPASRPLVALAWMTGAIASFTLMAVAGRTAQEELNSFQLMMWRSLIGLVVVSVLITFGRRGWSEVRSAHPGLHLTRNVVHFAGQNLWFYGIMAIPLSQLVALEFTLPIWVALMAPIFLGEALTRRKLIAAFVGFVGVLIVARPGLQPLGPGHAAGLLAAVCFAFNLIWTKRIMQHDGVLCVLFWMTLLQAVFGALTGFAGGLALPSADLWPWIGIVGLTGLTAHYALTSALAAAPASVVAPMEFLRLPVISIVGALVYAEALDPVVFIGAAVIFAATYMTVLNERQRLRALAAEAHAEGLGATERAQDAGSGHPPRG